MIPFTQYLLPDGRRQAVNITRSPDVERQADALIRLGYRFGCEMLTDYTTVSLTVHDPRSGDDIAIELVANGPLVPTAVDRLVAQATAAAERLAQHRAAAHRGRP